MAAKRLESSVGAMPGAGRGSRGRGRVRRGGRYTAVSVWLCEDSRSTSRSRGASACAASYSTEDEWLKRLASAVCLRRASASAASASEPRESSPCRNAFTTRIYNTHPQHTLNTHVAGNMVAFVALSLGFFFFDASFCYQVLNQNGKQLLFNFVELAILFKLAI